MALQTLVLGIQESSVHCRMQWALISLFQDSLCTALEYLSSLELILTPYLQTHSWDPSCKSHACQLCGQSEAIIIQDIAT